MQSMTAVDRFTVQRWISEAINDNETRFARVLFSFLALLACVATTGCSSTTQETPTNDPEAKHERAISLPTATAEDYLKQVLTRYRNAKSYRDEGEVVLRVEKDGRRIRQIAPMNVALDANRVWIAAYDARLWSDASETLGWIANEKNNFHDSQVVVGMTENSRPPVARPSLEFLLRDPILAERMVAGLGGPPPQLEWLLDPEPMARLFNEDTDSSKSESSPSDRSIEYEGVLKRDGQPRVVVRAIANGDKYLFWIDKSTSVIHSVDLPVSMTGQQVELDGWTVHSLELKLVNAHFDQPKTTLQLSDMKYATLPTRPRYVNALVPLPPPLPSSRLGSSLGTFQATDRFQNVTVSQRGSGRPFTVFFAAHLDDDDSSEFRNFQAAAKLVAWFNRLSRTLKQTVQIIAFSNQASEKMFADTGILVLQDTDAKLRGRVGIESGQVSIVDSDGTLLWIGDPTDDSDAAVYASVISDSASGIDVPSQMRKQSQLEQAAYREKLREVSVRFAE